MATMAENVIAAGSENRPPMLKKDHVDAYDSDCDDETTANAICMASLSSARSLNDDTVGPTYNSNTLSEVPHYDTYLDDDMTNFVVQETKYNEHFVSADDSYSKLTSNNNVISYAEYMVTIKDEAAQKVLSPIQNDDKMLNAFEQIKFKVEQFHKCESPNLDSRIQKIEDENVSLAFQVSSIRLLKITSEPINTFFKNNKAVHRDYLKVTKEHLATLQELLKEAKALKPLDEHIGHASKFAKRIQELLVYNGVVKRQNRTLVEAARTMLSATKVPLFFWAEAIATACFTQNHSLVIPHHEKTPY
nr:putative ribonuclease H-like domain-containing protein [Tanacetum cinerariifolium]